MLPRERLSAATVAPRHHESGRVGSRGPQDPPTEPSAHAVVSRSVVNPLVMPVVGLVALRIATSWNWINGAFFGADKKISSAFLDGSFLKSRIGGPTGFAHTAVSPGIRHFLIHTVAVHAELFAWVIFLGEAVAAISLLLGLFTRIGGLVAVLSAVANLLAAGGGGADTIGQNYLLLVLGIVFCVVGAGRWFGIDGWLQARYPTTRWLRIVG